MRAVVLFTDDTHEFDGLIEGLHKFFGDDRGVQVYAALDDVAGKLLDVFNEQDRVAALDGNISYTKRPVTIEARQFNGISAHDVYQWVEGFVGSFDVNDLSQPIPNAGVSIDAGTGEMVIATLEGLMRVSIQDWVIKGVKGEFYPCKPDIFAATYSPAVQ